VSNKTGTQAQAKSTLSLPTAARLAEAQAIARDMERTVTRLAEVSQLKADLICMVVNRRDPQASR
jgi:cob(I)alamin adenosyltransferase